MILRQARIALRPTRVAAVQKLTGASLSAKTVSQNRHPKRDTASPQSLQQRLGPSRFPKAGDRKVVAHQQRALNQHAVSRE